MAGHLCSINLSADGYTSITYWRRKAGICLLLDVLLANVLPQAGTLETTSVSKIIYGSPELAKLYTHFDLPTPTEVTLVVCPLPDRSRRG